MPYIRDKSCEFTGVQENAEYRDSTNTQCDFVMVYGLDATTTDRINAFRDKGYVVHLMTGIAWGAYQDYLKGQYDGREHWDESQTQRDGSVVGHGPETPYMVPTISFADYITEKIKPAIDAGVLAVHFEEPEYWSFGGYAEAFKREFELYYRRPWQRFHESVDSVYDGSKLMAYLYTRTLDRVCSALKEYAKVKYDRVVRFYVPTHSLLSYTQIHMVSPESKLMEIPSVDGYIAQIWTGTSRMPSLYNGVRKERTFETGFFEYGIMQELVKGSDRRMWFLHDPVEDDPGHDWADYEYNYVKTVVASLYQPHIWHYEIAPWPHRVFDGTYPRGAKFDPSEAQPIPRHYTTLLANIMNMLGDMDQPIAKVNDLDYGVGVFMADSCMYQRQLPDSCAGENDPTGINAKAVDMSLPDFMGLAMPLIKHGLPVRPVQLDNVNRYPGYLKDYDVLILSYEFFKPDSPSINTSIANWVAEGGVLVYVGDGSDPFHGVKSWWNQNGEYNTPAEHLMEQLGLGKSPANGIYTYGKGQVSVLNERPALLCETDAGSALMRDTVEAAMATKGYRWNHTNVLLLRRGTYLVVSCMDESCTDTPFCEDGLFVDMTDPYLPVVKQAKALPNENKIFFDLNTISRDEWRIIGTSLRIHAMEVDAAGFTIDCEGIDRLDAVLRLRFAKAPACVSAVCKECGSTVPVACEWDEESATALLKLQSTGKRLIIKGTF